MASWVVFADIERPSYLSTAIGMLDLHKGDRFPIGCAIVTESTYPALRSDIGCGIALYPLWRIPSHLRPESSHRGSTIVTSMDHGTVVHADWPVRDRVAQHTECGESVGTSGARNHPTEIYVIEETVYSESCEFIGLRKGEMYLLGELLGVLHENGH